MGTLYSLETLPAPILRLEPYQLESSRNLTSSKPFTRSNEQNAKQIIHAHPPSAALYTSFHASFKSHHLPLCHASYLPFGSFNLPKHYVTFKKTLVTEY